MSDRDYTNSPCYILMNTQESETESEIEAMYLAKYKNIEKLRISTWKTLDEINKQIKEISTTTGTLDKAKLGNLQTYKRRISNKIESYNKNLRSLEETQPLKDIVERHRTKESERVTREYRERIIKETQETIDNWRKQGEELQRRFSSENEKQQNSNKLKTEGYFEQQILESEREIEKAKEALRNNTANYQDQPTQKAHQQKEQKEQKPQYRKHTYAQIQLLLMSLSISLPLIIMNAPLLLILITTLLIFSPAMSKSLYVGVIVFCLYDIVRPILYIAGIIVAAQGPQDFVAIAFYIITGLQALSILKKFIATVLTLIISFKK